MLWRISETEKSFIFFSEEGEAAAAFGSHSIITECPVKAKGSLRRPTQIETSNCGFKFSYSKNTPG
jgi:hypothetical protein